MLYDIIKDTKSDNNDNSSDYLDHIGLFFFFTGCAGVSIVVWIFNWVCWINQCCCCDFLHNPVNKRIAWWMSFTFLLGILACCISAFVTVNRFGFAIDGVWCAVDRIYYDSKFGQLKQTYPKWEGFDNTTNILSNISKFVTTIVPSETETIYDGDKNNTLQKFLGVSCEDFKVNDNEKIPEKMEDFSLGYENFKYEDLFKNEDLIWGKYHSYAKTLKACLKVLSMIYYCLFLIAVTLAGVSMMFYACLKRQGYLLTFMHILWNVIRFFMFSFFLYGTAYGIFFLILRDMVSVTKFIFSVSSEGKEGNLDGDKEFVGGGGNFLNFCLKEGNTNLIYKENLFPIKISTSIDTFFKFYIQKKEKGSEEEKTIVKKINDTIFCKTEGKTEDDTCKSFLYLLKRASEPGGIFGAFDCGFVKHYLNNLLIALYDASTESRILAATSLSASFFGAVAIYFFLLVMHHYNNELFFDTGKSIFTGFDGFGGGYKKKNVNKDPAYKKRKLRAEIELTSKNDEASNYKDVNKNDDDE